jgi:outer membrane protein
MHQRKKNWWRCLPFLLLVVFGGLHPESPRAQEALPEHQPGAPVQDEAPALTLADVIGLALHDNRSLLSSAYGVESRQLSVEAAQSEFEWKLFPQATATATDETRRIGGGVAVEKKFAPGPIASVSPEIVRNYDSDDDETYGSVLGVSLTMPLLRGFGREVNLDGVQTARYSLRTARRSHYLVKVNTVLEAVAAVYNIVQQRELVRLYADQARRFYGHAVMAQAREKIGLASPIDVYRAQIRLKDAQDGLNRSQEALRNAGDRLKIVLATPLEQAVQVVAPLDCQPVDIGIVQAVETALRYRVELKQVDDDMEEARRASRISKNDLSPQLDLVANYTRLGNDDAFAGAPRLSEEFWSINLVSTTDWSRTAAKATYRQSLLAVKQVELNRSTRIDGIKREVRQFYDALQKARERMQIRKDQIDQARGKLALAKIKFSHGMANNFDLIEAETELQEARSNLLAAQIEYIVGMYRLRAAIGTLIEL